MKLGLCPALFCFVLPFAVFAGDSPFSPASVRYNLKVKVEIPAGEEKNLRLWIPYPADNTTQKILRVAIDAPYPWQINREDRYGNKMLFIKGKVKKTRWFVTMDIDLERRIDTGTPPEKINGDETMDPKNYLGPTPSIPFSDEIIRIAQKETRGLETSFQKIQALYDYIYETMTYNKDGEGWGQGDPVWACANKRGNCTDFHSLFIALANTQNIPARFEIGLPISHDKTSGKIPGYHCWAQAFDPVRGWVPLDASESKKRGEKYFYFKKLGQDRILFSTGRGITLNPPQKGEPINYFFSPYSEIEDERWDAVKASYFVTAGTTNGNIGEISEADALCVADDNYPGAGSGGGFIWNNSFIHIRSRFCDEFSKI
ncbi:MAG: transglutaminase domain-containing protein [Deltaproteobacteria bacterium]|nr:transglutaminase domain-containing protein [Deltaproteobacteria bacterium]